MDGMEAMDGLSEIATSIFNYRVKLLSLNFYRIVTNILKGLKVWKAMNDCYTILPAIFFL